MPPSCLQVDTVLVYENANAMSAKDTPFDAVRDHWWKQEVGASLL